MAESQPLNTRDAAAALTDRLAENPDRMEAEEEIQDEAPGQSDLVDDTADDAEFEAEEVEESTDEESSGGTLEYLSDLAEALGVEMDDLTNLRHKFRAHGEDQEQPLSELVAGYQRQADYTRKTKEIAEQRKQFEAIQSEALQAYQRDAGQLAQYLNGIERVLVGEMDGEEMVRLKAADPTQWAVRRQEMQERHSQIQQYRDAAAADYNRRMEAFHVEQQQKLSDMLANEQEALLSSIPEWGDDVKAEVSQHSMDRYGFTVEELGQVYDHRQVRMARDAMLYHQLLAKTKTGEKKVREAPKMAAPQKPKKRMTVDDKNRLALQKRFKRTGKVDDAAALLEQRFRGR